MRFNRFIAPACNLLHTGSGGHLRRPRATSHPAHLNLLVGELLAVFPESLYALHRRCIFDKFAQVNGAVSGLALFDGEGYACVRRSDAPVSDLDQLLCSFNVCALLHFKLSQLYHPLRIQFADELHCTAHMGVEV